MTATANTKIKPAPDALVTETLQRIRAAVDRVAEQLDLAEPVPTDGQESAMPAERVPKQSHGGLLRTALQRGSMLITKESSNRLAAERKSATDDLSGHVGSVLRELNTVRTETKRLLDQRRQLEVYLTALKTELETLRAEKLELMALKAQVRPDAPVEADVDLVNTPVTPAPASHGSDAEETMVIRASRSQQRNSEDITPRANTDEDAFQAFLQADEDHDKSREWFLSQTH